MCTSFPVIKRNTVEENVESLSLHAHRKREVSFVTSNRRVVFVKFFMFFSSIKTASNKGLNFTKIYVRLYCHSSVSCFQYLCTSRYSTIFGIITNQNTSTGSCKCTLFSQLFFLNIHLWSLDFCWNLHLIQGVIHPQGVLRRVLIFKGQ